MSSRESIKQEILRKFRQEVQGVAPDLRKFNSRHDGAEGDWLTKRMGLTVNGKNEPDFKGFEMKKESPKTTFGDWSPNIALYKKDKITSQRRMTRLEFLQIFGRLSTDQTGRKMGRYSWSGNVFPKVNQINDFGQTLVIDSSNNVIARYSFTHDQRDSKQRIVPEDLQRSNVMLVQWSAEFLQIKLEKKFNNFGWFKCFKDETGKYSGIQFGYPINFEFFIAKVRSGEIFCDCGMYSDNVRPYYPWRANKRFWDSLAEETVY